MGSSLSLGNISNQLGLQVPDFLQKRPRPLSISPSSSPSKKHFSIELISGKCADSCEAIKASVGNIVKTCCPSIYSTRESRMVPTPFLVDGKTQTVYSVLQARKRDKHTDIKYDRQTMIMSDKGLVSLDWYPQRPPLLKSTQSSDSSIGSRTNAESKGVPIVIVIPGSMGSSSEYYIRHLAKTLSTCGPPDCRVVVLNHRGYARTPLLTTRFQSFAFTDDIHEVVQYLSESFPDSSLGAVGFSMGANMLTKYLGDQGEECKLSAAVTICCPYNVAKLYETILKPTLFNNRVLQPNMTESAQKFIRRNKDIIQSGSRQYDIDALLKAKNVRQIDELLIAPISGYSSLEAYYAESSSGPVVSQIVTPLLAINSKDDPMVPIDAIPIDSFRSNPNTALVLTGRGGHLGFFSGIVPKIWYMDPLVQFFSALL